MRILKLLLRVSRKINPIRDPKLRSVFNKTLLVLFVSLIPLLSYSQDKDRINAKTDALKAKQGINKPEPNAVNRAAQDQPFQILSNRRALEELENNKQELQTDERCGATLIESMIKSQYPNRKSTEQFEEWMRNSIKTLKQRENNGAALRAVYTIPVVVHIIEGGSIVVSDAQVATQIQVLNDDFRRLNSDAASTPDDFLPVAADLELNFVLATVDPDGNATNGINRYNGGQSSYSIGNMESTVKPATIWHPDFYFNIWCAPLQGGLLGYAQFPSSSTLPGFDDDEGPSYTDGIVVRDLAFGLDGTSQPPFNLGRTTTHEAGHFFGLRHIWGDGGCGVDDYCEDTPTQGASTDIGSPCNYPDLNTCDDGAGDLPDQFMNYMDYSDDACMNLFTQDQKARVDVVMELSPRRASLITSQVGNGVPPDYPYDPFADAPVNDLCDGAEPIKCGDEIIGTTTGSSGRDVPGSCGTTPGGPGVWYVAVGDGSDYTVGTCNQASFDTKINVYSGSCEALSCVGGNDDGTGCGGFTSEVTFTSVDGESYYIYVSGFSGATGDFTLSLNCGDEPPPSDIENDFCEDAIAVECGETIEGTTIGAVQDVTGSCDGVSVGAPGVWYSFTGTGEFVQASTCNQADYDTKIHVVTGECDGDLSCVTANDDGPGCSGFTSQATFFSELDVEYLIYVNGFFGSTGNFSLTLECIPPPANDLCEGAIALECDSVVEGSTRFASAADVPGEFDCEPDSFGDLLGEGVWYTIEGTGGEIILSACGTANYDTKIDVYTGECGELVCYAGNDDGPGCPGFTSELQFSTSEGEIYYIYMTGWTSSFSGNTSVGEFVLSVDCVCIADAGECATVYNGYEPASCTNLTASLAYGEGPYDYQWSNGDSGETITVCPVETTTYTVTITDALGCVDTDDVTVEVIDVSCGKKGDKVQVYHNPNGPRPKTLCISSDDVEDHLAHGDILGPEGTVVSCGDPYTGEGDTSPGRIASNSLNDKWSMSPNPANGKVNLNLEYYLGRDLSLQVLDFSGEILIDQKISGLKNSRYDLNIKDIPYGIYFVRLITDSETIIKKLIVIR